MFMEKERLMELLRNPQKFQHKQDRKAQAQKVRQERAEKAAEKATNNRITAIVGGTVCFLALASLLFIFSAQKRATNITASLDPSVLKGLMVDATFNPNANVKYIQLSAGQDRNVTVTGAGASSILPVISRFNYSALTPENYEIIGQAPWALTINIESNLADPVLINHLLNNENVTKGFLNRKDVAPLLADPKALAEASKQKKLNAFLASALVQKILGDPKLLNAVVRSRFFSSILISKAVKYYRDHPQEAADLIAANPALAELKKNQNVRREIEENPYLKKISSTLLK